MAEASTQSMLVALADAVVTAINAGHVAGQPIMPAGSTAVRKFAPIKDLSTVTSALTVYVLPINDNETRIGGGPRPTFDGKWYSIDQIIYQRVGVGEAAETACAAAMLVRQDIRDLLKASQLTVIGRKQTTAVVEAVHHGDSAVYSASTLVNEHVLVAVQTFYFRMSV